MGTTQPQGEKGTARLPWDVLPRAAVRDDAGRVWVRDSVEGSWFPLRAPAMSERPLTPDPLDAQPNLEAVEHHHRLDVHEAWMDHVEDDYEPEAN